MSKKNKKTAFNFSKSTEERQCRLCDGLHKIGYVTFVNGAHHLVMVCDVRNINIYIPFEDGLRIPRALSKKAREYNKQLELFAGGYYIERKKRTKIALKPL